MKIIPIIFGIVLISIYMISQRTYEAARINLEIKIDGHLDEEAWKVANMAMRTELVL